METTSPVDTLLCLQQPSLRPTVATGGLTEAPMCDANGHIAEVQGRVESLLQHRDGLISSSSTDNVLTQDSKVSSSKEDMKDSFLDESSTGRENEYESISSPRSVLLIHQQSRSFAKRRRAVGRQSSMGSLFPAKASTNGSQKDVSSGLLQQQQSDSSDSNPRRGVGRHKSTGSLPRSQNERNGTFSKIRAAVNRQSSFGRQRSGSSRKDALPRPNQLLQHIGGSFAMRSLSRQSSNGSVGGSVSSRASRRKGPSRHNSNSSLISQQSSSSTLNVFGSDMVSNDFILRKLDELEANDDIVKVEMEDCLATTREKAIPLRLKEILRDHIRPWEGVHFVDELLDGYSYPEFCRNKRRFLRAMDNVCARQLIPVTYNLKVHLKLEGDGECSSKAEENSTIQLIDQFRDDNTITAVHVSASTASLQLINALTHLLNSDRKWDPDMTLRIAPVLPTMGACSRTDNMKLRAIDEAMENLKQASESKGIQFIPNYED
ncbi:expressed unknown protein [Seminavis robusta]|uniref:Uncharacterized protein n=1 Tax=Seminavis robusta TaxID=568900 RepID=A0A9N8H3L2_9STRA|nr:expressed unknown protein [Seminavis robusta]|eukprot:Sro90_g047280.1 n/a (490) ;mRNA; r:28336-29805